MEKRGNTVKYDKYWIGIGDIHGDPGNVARIPGVAEAAGVVVSGDLTTHGGVDAARRVIDAVRRANPVVLAQIGNMDTAAVGRWLEDEGLSIHGQARELAPGVGLVGVGCSSPTPFGTPSEVPDERLGELLEQALARAGQWDATLLVAHDPPHGTTTDLVGTRHVGSRAVRAFVERVQPDVCLSGHIHESRALDFVGRTAVVNPGMLAQGGYAVIGLAGRTLTVKLRTL